MTDDDRFFATFGKIVCMMSFLFVMICAVVGVALLYVADVSYRTDTRPLQAPPTLEKGK